MADQTSRVPAHLPLGDDFPEPHMEPEQRPIRGINAREHWRERAKRVKVEREATAWAIKSAKSASGRR